MNTNRIIGRALHITPATAQMILYRCDGCTLGTDLVATKPYGHSQTTLAEKVPGLMCVSAASSIHEICPHLASLRGKIYALAPSHIAPDGPALGAAGAEHPIVHGDVQGFRAGFQLPTLACFTQPFVTNRVSCEQSRLYVGFSKIYDGSKPQSACTYTRPLVSIRMFVCVQDATDHAASLIA